MTIRNCINAAALNERWSNLEECANEAPDGTYEQAKAISEIICDSVNGLIKALRSHGLKVHNDDRLREVEAILYGYIVEANADVSEIHSGEGYGSALRQGGAVAERVKTKLRRDRDFLRSIGAV